MAAIDDHHAEWLSLVEVSGPFLTVPALKKALPHGLGDVTAVMSDLRVAHAQVSDDPDLQRRWVDWVLGELLGFGERVREATDADPSYLVAEHGVRVRPTHVVRDPSRDGAPVLLVHRHDGDAALDRPLRDDRWSASPIDRAVELAKASEVPLALVTNGSRWTLAWARQNETTGLCTWRSELWIEEPLTLRAFVELLGARRFFNLSVEESLANLLSESAGKQQEVADQLGAQVRRATELLIATLDREDRDRHGELLQELPADEVYRGAVTVMMRLVFLFVAEERRLLPLDDPRYAETLAASTLRAQLRERADAYSESILSGHAAWHRVLALFRAVHGGIEHDALRLPAYGGGLFDPDRYPFLEGRPPGSAWEHCAAAPLPVDDRTMLHILDQLQTLEQGGTRVALSYQALDVEQIGHVYEGLLDHTALRISDVALGLSGKKEPEIALGQLDDWEAAGTLVATLAKETGKTAKAIEKALAVEPDDMAANRLRAVCENDDAVLDRVRPYFGLLRIDLRGDPLIFPAGSLYVTQAIDRRASGTYYTPRVLAEEVVKHTLDPIAYDPGPAQEPDPAKWDLKSSRELLELKVCDIAMGSGAFLVAACRYLAARLLEAWEREDEPATHDIRHAMADREPPPADPGDREQLAKRLVAERCLYGVDKNPMAVEMAKLSLWLVTLAKDRPFSFVDHALRTGDSLLGVTEMRQLRVMHLDPGWHRQASISLGLEEIELAVAHARLYREDLEAFVVRDIADAERKALMLEEADRALGDARVLADLVVGAALAQHHDADPLLGTTATENARWMLRVGNDAGVRAAARTQLRDLADDWLVEHRRAVGEVEAVEWADRHPFHWALEFPEVRARGGFDAIVGNPPFQGGKKISGALGGQYRDHLVTWLADGVRGNADLVAYFYLRAARLLRPEGGFGLIATNTIAQGDTREVGLDRLADSGWTLHRAISSEPWPGGANLEMATVWARRAGWVSPSVLDGVEVGGITPALAMRSRVEGNADRLHANLDRAYQGTVVVGMGFVLSPDEATAMLAADPRNAEVVRPYLVGEDLNQRHDGSPARWVIDFRDWSEERAREYTQPFARVERHVLPERAAKRHPEMSRLWWRFWRRRAGLYRTIAPLDRCIAITLVSKVVQPMFVPTDIVYAHALGVFAYDDDAHFGLLSSGLHWWWAVTRASTLETRVRYTPTDCFETFPQPELTPVVVDLGARLHEYRSALMLDRREGLTKTYNRVHDPGEQADDVVALREIHVALDHAVRDAYGWSDLDLGHDFHDTKFGTRYTFAPVPRQEILDRLLELNHVRYADEVRRGLHAKASKPKRRPSAEATGMLFDA